MLEVLSYTMKMGITSHGFAGDTDIFMSIVAVTDLDSKAVSTHNT